MVNRDERDSTGNGCATGSIRCELRHSRTIAAATEVDSSKLEFDHAWSTRNDFRCVLTNAEHLSLSPDEGEDPCPSHHDHRSIRLRWRTLRATGPIRPKPRTWPRLARLGNETLPH